MEKIEISECPYSELSNIKEWYNGIQANERNELSFKFDNDTFYLLKVNNISVGLMSVLKGNNKYCDLRRFVKKEYCHKGLAEIMLNYLFFIAKREKIKSIQGTIKKTNTKGATFLESKGFKMAPFIKNKIIGEDYYSAEFKF